MPRYSLRTLQHFAIAISVLSIFYNGAEGAVSIALGAESDSRSLVFFGIQSGIEVAASIIVVWRFRKVAKPGEESTTVIGEKELRVEKVGSWSIGILLILLSLATLASAIAGLVQHTHPDSSNAALIISASALVIMILIWLPKVYLARALNSSTMQGEATCSLSCIQITVVLFVGALVYRVWKGGWWVDDATSLVLGLMFGREGYNMLQWVRDPSFDGGCCKTCKTPKLPIEDPEAGSVYLEESYKDLCGCCVEKTECKAAGSCVCGHGQESNSRSVSVDEISCCKPVDDAGAKCCTHETRKGTKPRPQTETGCASGCCGGKPQPPAPAESKECKDACCSDKKSVRPLSAAKDDDVKGRCSEDSCCSPPPPFETTDPACSKGCCSPSPPNNASTFESANSPSKPISESSPAKTSACGCCASSDNAKDLDK